MIQNTKTAGLIIIGNEILNGRKQDTNTSTIAKRLEEIGVRLTEVRIIPDVIDTIIGTLKNNANAKFLITSPPNKNKERTIFFE